MFLLDFLSYYTLFSPGSGTPNSDIFMHLICLEAYSVGTPFLRGLVTKVVNAGIFTFFPVPAFPVPAFTGETPHSCLHIPCVRASLERASLYATLTAFDAGPV